MAQGINSVHILGNLGKDPEMREGNGTAICKFTVAVGERKKDGDSWVDHTEWFSVVCFGKTAENAGKYLAKGRQVFVEGRLSTRQYEKDGVTRYFTEVVASNVVFVGGAPTDKLSALDAEQARTAARNTAPVGRPSGGQQKANAGFVDDDLPFSDA